MKTLRDIMIIAAAYTVAVFAMAAYFGLNGGYVRWGIIEVALLVWPWLLALALTAGLWLEERVRG